MTDFAEWTKRLTPGLAALAGERVRLEPLDWAADGAGLFAAVGGPANAPIWEWMPVGPFLEPDALNAMLEHNRKNEGWKTMVIRRRTDDAIPGDVLGMATYMRIREAHG